LYIPPVPLELESRLLQYSIGSMMGWPPSEARRGKLRHGAWERNLIKLRSFPGLLATHAMHRAIELGFGLRRRGITIPVTGCVIAAATESTGASILTLDEHFAHLAREANVEIR
jgi:predicted nucleic acid-binding protein